MQTANNNSYREKKSLKKKQRTANMSRTAKTGKPALPVSLPEVDKRPPNKKMRTKENLFNHVDDDDNAYLDAQEEKRNEYCENQEDLDQVYSKMSATSWIQDHEYVKFQMNQEEFIALDSSNVKVYERLSSPELDPIMTLAEYEAHLLKEESYWNLWKSHGLSRKQYEDHDEYEKNCNALRNLTMDDPAYEVLLNKIKSFEDEMDSLANEEETKMNEWFLNFEANNPELMARILQSSGADI